MSGEAFPADPALPQLKIAVDPRRMLELLRQQPGLLATTPCHVRDCVLSRIRYRRARRCVLQYTLRLVDPATGRERSQWVSGALYAGHRAQRIWERLQGTDGRRDMPEAFRTVNPVSFIPDLGMLLQVFPYDRRLPSLPLLMTGPPPVLEPLLRGGSGPVDGAAWSVEPIRYRAHLGAVLRYAPETRTGAADRGGAPRFYVKVYRDDEGERTHHILGALWGRVEGRADGFTVARPVAYLSDMRALVQMEVPGPSLREVVLESREPTATIRRVARALAAFNQETVSAPRRHRLADEVAALRRAAALLGWTCPHLAARIEEIVGAAIAGLEEVPPGPTHRDLKADHIVIGGGVALLDLDWLAEADPVLDPAALLAGLVAMPLRHSLPRDVGRTAARTFTDEYFAHVPKSWRRRLPVHYAGATLKEAVGFFRRQEPHWPDRVGALVEEAGDSLAGRVW